VELNRRVTAELFEGLQQIHSAVAAPSREPGLSSCASRRLCRCAELYQRPGDQSVRFSVSRAWPQSAFSNRTTFSVPCMEALLARLISSSHRSRAISEKAFDSPVFRLKLHVEAHLGDAGLVQDVVDPKTEAFFNEAPASGRKEAGLPQVRASSGASAWWSISWVPTFKLGTPGRTN